MKSRFYDEFQEAQIEILAVCRKCGTHWCSIEEYKTLDKCEICKTDKYLEHYCDFEDVKEYLRNKN